jgi:hypothetical protein
VNLGVLEWANRSGGYYDPFRGRLVNRGVWRKTTGEVVELENATLVNEAGGVLELAAGSLYRNAGSATLQNSGLIKKVSSNSVALQGLTITGSGRVQVEEGVLQLDRSTLADATVQVAQGVMYWHGAAAGAVRIESGTVGVNWDLTVADGGTLTVAQGGQLVWTAGDLVVSSGAQLVNEGVLEWANRSGGYYDPFRGRLVNRGVWRKTTGEVVELENATLVNEAGGVLELAVGGVYRNAGSATLQNSGLIKKVSSNSVALQGLTITGSGRVQVEEGVLQLEWSTLADATVQVAQGVMYWYGSAAGAVRIESGTVGVNWDLTVADGGTLTVAQGGQLVWTAGDLVVSSGAQLVNEGVLEWANRSGGYYDPFRGRLVNRGVWRKTTGEVVELENATLVNEAGGVLELVAGSLYRNAGSATLQNSGVIKKVSSNSVALQGLTITGSGRVQVEEGVLQLEWSTLADATVQVAQGVMYWYGSAAGAVRIESGTVGVNWDLTVADGGTLTVAQGGQLVWTAGDLVVSSGAQLVNEGVLEWANRSGGYYDPFRGRLVNRGVWRKTTGEWVELENATLVNEAGGVLELAVGGVYRNAGSATLQNSGLIKKVSSNSAGLSGITLTGSGRVQVEEGVLQLDQSTLADATVQVAQGVMYWHGAAAGAVRIESGTVGVNGDLTVADGGTLTVAQGGQLVWTAGDLVVSSGAQLVNEGVLEWANRSGGYYDPFRGRLVNRGVWRKTTGEWVELENATLVNEAGGVLELAVGGVYRYSGSAVLQNAGLVKKQSPNPNNPVSAGIEGVACTNSGEWLVADGTLSMQNSTYTQTDGQLTVYGTLSCNNTLQIAGGMVRGLGTINASVNNTGGIVHPGDETRRGALTIWNGNYSQGADAELRLTITGLQPNEYDRLVVARASGSGADVGRVFLDGKLKAIFESYVPAENDAFNILSYRLRDGQFAELEVEGLACGVAELEYLANAARLRVVQTGNREEPGVGFVAGPANGSRVCSLPVVFRWRGCDNDTPVENLQYRYRVDGGAWSAWSSETEISLESLADGVHVFEVQARDASGNESQIARREFVLDTTPPVLQNVRVDDVDFTAVTIRWETDEPATAQVRYRVAGTTNWVETPLNRNLARAHAVRLTGLLEATDYEYQVASADACGHLSVSPILGFSTARDTTPPTVSVIEPSEGAVLCESAVTFRWQGSDNRTPSYLLVYSWRIDGGDWSEWQATTTTTIPDLPAGEHLFEVMARDLAGNISAPAQRRFRIDTAPPVIANLRVENLTETSAEIAWQTDKATIARVRYRLASENNWRQTEWSSAYVTQHRVRLTDLAEDQEYVYQVEVRDRCGVTAESEVGTFRTRRDTTPPTVTITQGPAEGSTVCQLPVEFAWQGSDNRTPADQLQYRYRVNGGAWSAWSNTTQTTLNDLPQGTNVFEVQARDLAGNESQIARRSFRVDTQPPVFVSIRTENLRPTSAQVVVVTDEPSTGRVEYRRSDASEWQQVALTPAQTTHRATLSNLEADSEYVYRVVARDACGHETVSPTQSFRTPAGADLTVPSASAPAQATPTVPFNFSWVVRNDGALRVSQSWIDRVYFSRDETLDSGDTLLVERGYTGGLDAGQEISRNVAITLPANTPAGEGYLIVFVDALDAVAESNESNNTRAVAIRVQAVDNPPDTELTEAPDENAPVCSLPITLRWRGIDDQTPAEQLQYSYRIDNEPWSEWTSATELVLNELPDGAHIFMVRARDAAGQADPTPAIRRFIVAVNPPVISNVRAQVQQARALISWSTNIPATSQVEYGTTPSLGQSTPEDTQLKQLHQIELRQLQPNTTYYYRVRSVSACGQEAFSEVFTFRTGNIPDLTIEPVRIPNEMGTRQTYVFQWRVYNNGQGDAVGEWYDGFYLSRDNQYDSNDRIIRWVPRAGNLRAGTNYFNAAELRVPEVEPGEYYVILVVDPQNAIHESEEGNNTAVYGPVTIVRTDAPVIEDIPDATAEEGVAYRGPVPRLVQGTPPIRWSLESGPPGMVIDSNGQVFWSRPVGNINPYAITIRAENAAGADTETWLLRVDPTYSAEASTDVELAPSGTPVVIRGRAYVLATGQPKPNAAVKVRLRIRGLTRTLDATTDAQGNFTVTYISLPREAGIVELCATHPGDDRFVVQDTFTLVGMYYEPERVSADLIPFTDYEFTTVLQNAGNTPLTGIQYEILNRPAELMAQVQGPASLGDRESGVVRLQVRAESNRDLRGTLVVRAVSAEGATAHWALQLNIRAPRPVLQVSPAQLQAAMLRGDQTLVNFTVRNVGGAPTEPLRVALPNVGWMNLTTPSVIPPLAPDEEAVVTLQLTPPTDLPLGVYTGAIVVGQGLYYGVSVPFRFNNVSNRRGDLAVYVETEATFWGSDGNPLENGPLVRNAIVQLRHPETNEILHERVTESDREPLVFRDLQEGYYVVQVNAPRYAPYRQTWLVEGDRVTEVRAFIPREVVSYRWSVRPTDIPDVTIITLEAVFETNVPQPVVTVNPPLVDMSEFDREIGSSSEVTFTIENRGLIDAENVALELPSHPDWEFTALVDQVRNLAPGERIVVPVRVTRVANTGRGDCIKVSGVRWELVCRDRNYYRVPIVWVRMQGDCPGGGIASWGGGGGSGSGTGLGGGWSSGGATGGSANSPFFYPPSFNPPLDCDRDCDPATFPEMPRVCLDTNQIIPIRLGKEIVKRSIKEFVDFDLSFSFLPKICAQEVCENGRRCLKFSLEQPLQLQGSFSLAEGKQNAITAEVSGELQGNPIRVCVLGKLIELEPTAPGSLTLQRFSPQVSGSIGLTISVERNCEGQLKVSASVGASVDVGGIIQFGAQLEPRVVGECGDFGGQDGRNPIGFEGTLTIQFAHSSRLNAEVTNDVWRYLEPFEGLPGEGVLEGDLLFPDADGDGQPDRVPIEPQCLRYYLTCPAGGATPPPDCHTIGCGDFQTQSDEFFVPEMALIRENIASQLRNLTLYQYEMRPVQDMDRYLTGEEGDFQPASGEEGICARVRLQLQQEVVLSRQAFNAELEIANASDTENVEGVLAAFQIFDEAGNEVTDRFAIYPPTLHNITAVDGTGRIAPNTVARVNWIIVPRKTAAPREMTRYYVSGLMSYIFEGGSVTAPLLPAPIDVLPDPSLELDYFWQREVFADDPFTPEVEPSEPFSLGLRMLNTGYGTARNVRVISGQPRIVENERNLPVEFRIIGSQVNDDPITPSLTVNLGDLPPMSSAVARWLMISNFQGRFVEFNATYRHVNPLNDDSLSLIDRVDIHELDHVVRILHPADDRKPDFLVNADPDPDYLPDVVFNSTGEVHPVTARTDGVVDGPVNNARLQARVTLSSPPSGFVYIRIPDPSGGQHPLLRVIRSDGVEIRMVENAWTTHRVKRPRGGTPYREDLVHIFDYNSTGSYTLVYGYRTPVNAEAGEVKLQRDGVEVQMGGTLGLVVTAVFPDSIYVESHDRSAGIRVVGVRSAEGDWVRFRGVMRTGENGERYIEARELVKVGEGALDPLGMTVRSLYCGDFFYNPATGEGQRGMAGGAGLNVVGLLVQVTGTVTEAGDGYFMLTDGYGRNVGVWLTQGMVAPAVGSLARVTGVVTTVRVNGELYPVVRVRRPEDVQAPLEPIRVESPATVVQPGWNQFTLGAVPADPNPLVVLQPFDTGDGLANRLRRYDPIAQAWVNWDPANPTLFGGLRVGEGYQLQSTLAGAITFNGVPFTTIDIWLGLPKRGFTVVGHPFDAPVPWETVKVADGLQALPMFTAARVQSPPWLESRATYIDNLSQTTRTMGLPMDNPDSVLMEPWLGYRVESFKDNLALIVSNRAPIANDDEAVTEVGTPIEVLVLENDRSPVNRTLRIVEWTQGQHGSVAQLSDSVLVYTPQSGYRGLDSFTYTIEDADGYRATGTVYVTVGRVWLTGIVRLSQPAQNLSAREVRVQVGRSVQTLTLQGAGREGRFQLRVPAFGEYVVKVKVAGVLQQTVTVRPEGSDLTLVFAGDGSGLPLGDANGDNFIDDGDLLEVLFQFGQSGASLSGDLDGDGIVDDSDLLIVLFNFGQYGNP